MAMLQHLEPQAVFSYFEEICAIPHGSGNTKAISDYMVAFGKARGLATWQDRMGNVVIIKDAAPGYESAQAVLLQGHLDMVCEQAPDCKKDMTKEGLDLCLDGDFVYANGTTLGGDDGIAVAMIMAILDAKDLAHPRIEALLTVDEEIGMIGASALEDLSMITSRRMINIDSEEEGIFTVSCAGGNLTKTIMPITRAPFAGTIATITVGGLKGGHSGVEIDKGLGNACKLLGRVLNAMRLQTDLRVIGADGGMKDNAIPRSASATVVVSNADALQTICDRFQAEFQNEYRSTDPDVFVLLDDEETASVPMDQDSTDRLVSFLACAPNGIQAMSADMPGLVQTSLNIGVLATKENQVEISFCVRSSIDSQKQMLVEALNAFSKTHGATIAVSGDYTGWQYRKDSPLRDLLCQVYLDQYGKEPQVLAIHAGVECGILAGKLPGLDCISIGPNLFEIHTCRERLSVSSTRRLWKMLCETLKRMK